MSATVPIVRIELQGMRQQILHAFSEHMLRLDSDVQAAVDLAIRNFDIKGEVAKVFEAVAQEQIRDAVRSAMWDVFRNEDVKALLRERVLAALKESF